MACSGIWLAAAFGWKPIFSGSQFWLTANLELQLLWSCLFCLAGILSWLEATFDWQLFLACDHFFSLQPLLAGTQIWLSDTIGWKPLLSCRHFWLAAILGRKPLLAGSNFTLNKTKFNLQQKYVNLQPKWLPKFQIGKLTVHTFVEPWVVCSFLNDFQIFKAH